MNSSVVDRVGETPLVKLDLGSEKSEASSIDIYAKLEFYNPSGSIKDRLAKHFLNRIKADTKTLIIPSTGNLAIAIATLADRKRHKLIAVIPDRTSNDHVTLLKALGVEVVKSFNNEQRASIIQELVSKYASSEVLDEKRCLGDHTAYEDLANEIIKQTGEKGIDYVFVGVETGATVTALATHLKNKLPNVQVIGVEPTNSTFGSSDSRNHPDSKTEDLGSISVSPSFKEVANAWYKISDKEAFSTARRLIREHGILCGPSSGAVLAAATRESENVRSGGDEKPRGVVIFDDTARNYTSTLLNDDWMLENDLVDDLIAYLSNDRYYGASVEDLQLPPAKAIQQTTTVINALNLMAEHEYSQLPVLDEKKKLVGCVSLEDLENRLKKNPAKEEDAVKEHMISFRKSKTRKEYQIITLDTPLSELAKFFDSAKFYEEHAFAVVTDADRKWTLAVATKYDLMNFLRRR